MTLYTMQELACDQLVTFAPPRDVVCLKVKEPILKHEIKVPKVELYPRGSHTQIKICP